MREYDQIADWFAAARSEAGLPDVIEFARALPRGARVLELGCGTGIPISRYLLGQGFELFAIDSSEEMVRRFRTAFPQARIERTTIQESSFFGVTFDAAIAWGVLFHLEPADQELAIAKVARCLEPRGRFLFTAADVEGVTSSAMNGVRFRYWSLGREKYRDVLQANGMTLVDQHVDQWENYVYVARKLVVSAPPP